MPAEDRAYLIGIALFMAIFLPALIFLVIPLLQSIGSAPLDFPSWGAVLTSLLCLTACYICTRIGQRIEREFNCKRVEMGNSFYEGTEDACKSRTAEIPFSELMRDWRIVLLGIGIIVWAFSIANHNYKRGYEAGLRVESQTEIGPTVHGATPAGEP